MTKLIKKSVDIEKVLSKPRLSWTERLMAWGLSKPAIASAFVAITGWFGKAFAQDEETQDAWNIAFGKVTDTFQYSRKIIFILAFFFMILSVVFALVKKSWYWLFSLFTWLLGFAIIALVIDYVSVDNGGMDTFEITLSNLETKTEVTTIDLTNLLNITLACMVAFIICLLPIFIPLIQYKLNKIDKKLLKHRIFGWLMAGITWGVIVAISVGIYMLLNSLG